MTTTTSPVSEIKSCGCGCGATVRRSFLPGHDAKLKSRLLAETRSTDWWVREPAVVAMVNQGWGHFVDTYVLATTPVRNTSHGRFAQTRHIDSLHGVAIDSEGTGHSVFYCPAASDKGHWTKDIDAASWLCDTCIHTHDYSELVWMERKGHIALAEIEEIAA